MRQLLWNTPKLPTNDRTYQNNPCTNTIRYRVDIDDYVFSRKTAMNCQDCKYYNGTVQSTLCDYHICMYPKYKGLDSWVWVSNKVEKCKDFEPKESKDELR